MDSSDDRRLFERYSAKLPTKFKNSPDDYGDDVALRDFSASGVRLHTRERFFIDDVISIEVELPDGMAPVPLNGRICWSRAEAPSFWEVGMEFHKVNLFKLHRLVKFANEVHETAA
ncbi:MAG: PilZ domain-containing protein [Candidatus Omnitrophica bacterium]|nr:PilZ domain-containing protein [Candidatus Omnitrophota bacterium]